MAQGGNETLLVVDDEEEIRELTQEYLESLGYAVKTAESGEEALRIYGSEDENIHLVLLDLNMPGMGGVKCLEKLRELDPRARVLIASGYTSREHRAQSLASGAGGFIAKPFQMRELAEKIRKMLNAK